MKLEQCVFRQLLALSCWLCVGITSAFAQTSSVAGEAQPMTLSFNGTAYVHRWAKNGQYEFLPKTDSDLASWHDMVTIVVHESVTTGEKLAAIANGVLSNYQRHGKILRTESRPRTTDRPAEHLIVAVLGDPNFLEAAFARLILVDGVGMVVVYSHRVYGKPAGEAMSEWLRTQGPQVEKALMGWDQLPTSMALKQLPPK
jgi:hypothetical protein